MNFLRSTYTNLVKKTKHYLNPNENPTELDKYAFNLLDKAEVDSFIEFMEANEVNIHVVDFNKTSLLIKAQDIANVSNGYRKKFSEQQLRNRAIKAIKYLLHRGVDINYQGKNGTTALLASCHWQNYELVQILLQQGADPNLGTTEIFFTNPLVSALFKQNTPLVTLLIQYGADPLKAIQLNNKADNFKLGEKKIDFLYKCNNVNKLLRRKFYEKVSGKKGILSLMSEKTFLQLCVNV